MGIHRAGLYLFCVFLAAGASCSFEYSCGGGVNTGEVEEKSAEHITEKLGIETTVECPKLKKNDTFECTAKPEGGEEFLVTVEVGDERWDAEPEGVILASKAEALIAGNFEKRSIAVDVACGARVRPSRPGEKFTCKVTSKDGSEETTIYVRIKDTEGNVDLSETPFEDTSLAP